MSSNVILKLGVSKALAKAWVDNYNQGKKLNERLRSAHLTLIDKLLYYFEQHLGKLAYGHEISPLRTNNVQLAKALGCSQRTIHNLRERLEASGLIREEWNGSNTSWAVYLNPAILAIRTQSGQWAIGQEAPDFFFHPLQSLRHTVSGYIQQDTKESIKLSGAGFPANAGNAGESPEKAVENVLVTVENPHPGSGKVTDPVTEPGTSTGYETNKAQPDTAPPVAAAPPDAPPSTLADVMPIIPAELRGIFERHVNAMWLAAQATLYRDKWINDTQEQAGRALLAEYLAYGHPERWAAGANEVVERIMLVRRWIDRGLAKGEKRFVLLPREYFDIRNETGFRATKAWLKAHRKNVAAIKDRELLTRATNAYMKALTGESQTSIAETYRVISQRLGKRSGELIEDFNRAVVKIHDAQNQAAV